jgi:hypothetical protein
MNPWYNFCMDLKEYQAQYYKEHRADLLVRHNESTKRYYARNRKAIADKRKARCRENSDYFKNHRLKHKYAMTMEEYSSLLNAQDNKCAICHLCETKTLKGKLIPLSVDHNHSSGKNRQLLCFKCNVMIGLANESVQVFLSAIQYLQNNEKSEGR